LGLWFRKRSRKKNSISSAWQRPPLRSGSGRRCTDLRWLGVGDDVEDIEVKIVVSLAKLIAVAACRWSDGDAVNFTRMMWNHVLEVDKD
jgi:hypothetical protein